MTKEQIESLNPGIGLDVLTAEHVMGWKWIYEDQEQPVVTPYLISPRDSDGFGHVFYPSVAKEFPKVYPVQDMPPYSTDIKAAWEVITKIAEFAKWKIESIEENKTICVNLLQHEGILRFQAYAETAPLAICRAALLFKFYNKKN